MIEITSFSGAVLHWGFSRRLLIVRNCHLCRFQSLLLQVGRVPQWLGSQNVVDLLNISRMLKTFLSQSSKIGNGSLALNGCYEAMGLCRWKPGPIFCVRELHF